MAAKKKKKRTVKRKYAQKRVGGKAVGRKFRFKGRKHAKTGTKVKRAKRSGNVYKITTKLITQGLKKKYLTKRKSRKGRKKK